MPAQAQSISLLIERDDDVPVGVQLAWGLRSLIAAGRLAPGEQLPGVREIAERSAVNVNTARTVYARLEREGLIVSRHGLGTFVAEDPEVSADVERVAASAVKRARAAGVEPRDVARAIYATGASIDAAGVAGIGGGTGLPDVGRAADEAAARRELRRQIGRLERQLASYPEAREADETHPLLRPKAHVAGIGELEAVRDGLMDRLKRARSAAEERGNRQSRARGKRERMIGDPESQRWQTVQHEDCGDPGCGETRSVPRFGPIGAIAGWWRVKLSSGCP